MPSRFWSACIGAGLGLLAGTLLGKTARRASAHDPAELSRLRDARDLQWERSRTTVRTSAHDLRNPLTTIRARAELLKRSLGNGQSAEVRHVDAILRSSERLEAMVTQLSTAFREGTAEEGPALAIEKGREPAPS